MLEILIAIFVSIISTFLISGIFFLFSPIKRFIYKIIKKDFGTRNYIKWRNNLKIYLFPQKQRTRISVSVLARIKKDEKFLLKQKHPSEKRQDTSFKPLGGVIKITDSMKKIIRKPIEFDNKTRYTAKGNDFRIFLNISNNKIIHKVLYSEDITYYKDELKREIMEEMSLNNEEEFNDLFSFEEDQPFNVSVQYTELDFSVLNENDYVHHIIFELKIKDEEKLEEIIKNLSKNKIKFLELNGTEQKAQTSFILDKKNKQKKFKQKKSCKKNKLL